jgi:hypothetical protein
MGTATGGSGPVGRGGGQAAESSAWMSSSRRRQKSAQGAGRFPQGSIPARQRMCCFCKISATPLPAPSNVLFVIHLRMCFSLNE